MLETGVGTIPPAYDNAMFAPANVELAEPMLENIPLPSLNVHFL